MSDRVTRVGPAVRHPAESAPRAPEPGSAPPARGPAPVRVVLCICTWDAVQPETMRDIVRLVAEGAVASFAMITASLLPHARNELIRMCYRDAPDFTHLLFLDADMSGCEIAHVRRLLSHRVPIVGALAVRRRHPYAPACFPLEREDGRPSMIAVARELSKHEPGLVECVHVGAACTLVERRVLDALKEDTEEGGVWFTTDRMPRSNIADELDHLVHEMLNKDWPEGTNDETIIRESLVRAFELGCGSGRGSRLIGEDVYFCRRARAAGFRIYVDCGCQVKHVGTEEYHAGHYMQAAAQQRARIEAERPLWHGIKTPEVTIEHFAPVA